MALPVDSATPKRGDHGWVGLLAVLEGPDQWHGDAWAVEGLVVL